MEVLDDDDFSDLYADVEVQASSAIRALNGLREIPHGDGIIFENAARGEKGKGGGFTGTDIAGGNDAPAADGEEDGVLKVPLDSGDTWDDGSESEDDGNKQRFDHRDDNDKYDSHEETRVEIDGNEKCVSAGDYSRRKNLKYDSSIYEKREIDEGAHQVHKPRKNADADVGNFRDSCFNKASEDNNRNDGGGKVASTWVSRHTHARDPLPSDLDKYGSVQISDLVEGNHNEVSDCDSDGMLEEVESLDDRNIRNGRSRSNKVSSVSEPESSRSVDSQHGTSSSCPSVSAARSDDDIERGDNHSKRHSSISREYDRSKSSRSHATKPSIRDGRYDQRQRGLIRKQVNQQNKSNNMPGLRTHLINEDPFHAVDVMRPYNGHVSHGKKRAVLNFNSNEKGMPYCNQTVSFFTGFHGHFPGNYSGPTYSNNLIWKTHPSYGYKAGGHDGHNMGGRQDFIGKRSTKMDCEGMEDNWYSKQRRHVFQGDAEDPRKLIPKYDSSAANTRGTQFSNKGDAQHIRRTKREYLSPMRDYNNDTKGKYRRFMPSGDRQRNYVDHISYQNIANGRRETESSRRPNRRSYSPRRVNRKSYSPHNSSGNLWYGEAEDNGRRCIKRRPLPFYFHEEPYAPGRQQIQGAATPKSAYPERNARNSCKEMHIECGQYGTRTPTFDNREGLTHNLSENHDVRRRHYQRPTNTNITNGSIVEHHDLDHFVRRRHDQQPDVLHSRLDVYKSRQQDATIFHSEGPSHHFRRTPRNNRPDDRHAFGRVEEFINEREVDRHRFKVIREDDRRNEFDGCLKFIQADNFVQLSPTNQNSVDSRMVVGKKCTLQSSRRTSEAGDDFNCGKHELTEWNNYQKPINFEDLGDFNLEKAASADEGKVDTNLSDKDLQDKFSKKQQDEYLDIEEGQIISEEIKDHRIKSVIASKDMTQINDVELAETASDGIGVVEELGDQKIQEIMAKMLRRRERFKEPIFSGRDMEKNSDQSLNLAVEADKSKLERPTRKRRWLGT